MQLVATKRPHFDAPAAAAAAVAAAAAAAASSALLLALQTRLNVASAGCLS
jgi:hypothetical protein